MDVDVITPMFKDYLAYMCRFYTISDYDAWCEGALKNLWRFSHENDRYIYVIEKSGVVVGFTVVNNHVRFNRDGLAIAEFYIQKDHEKKGYGRMLAEFVFARFPGNWEVAIATKNTSARQFWEQVVSSYTHGQFIEKRTAPFDGSGFLFNNA